MTLAVSRSL